MTTFRDYLQDRHAESYHGTDDDMPDAFATWCEEDITDEELFDYFTLFMEKYPVKVVAKELYQLIS